MKKAVRDKIPEIIRKSGNSCRIKKLSDSKFLIDLEKNSMKNWMNMHKANL